ncbi:MAG: sulfatase-like hydrolase/transferase, partial [Leptospiraceae bacterium]|nr:sulfatase-like hydrolase/transferase [Leptospiraceae bacterium]
MSHKIRHMFPSKEEKNNLGSGFFPTLPQILKEHGFHTAVFSNFAGDIFPRANFGFDKTEAPNFSALVILVQKVLEPQVFLMPFLTGEFLGGGKFFKEVDGLPGLGDGRRILPEIRKYIRKNKNSPFFLTTFFSVTHFPYSPPYPYYKQFGDPNYRGQYKFFKFVDPSKSTKPSKKDMEQIRNVFNAAVHTFDQEFGELIRYLKEEGIYDSSFILVTGDHGEALYEGVHGQGHGEHLRGENISRVPLFIKYPSSYTGLKKGQIEEMSSSIDLLPTILDYYKIPTHKNFPGLSLNRLPNQKSKFTDRKVYTETGIWFSDKGEHFFQKERIMYPNILKLHTIIPSEGFQIMITKPEYKDKIAFAKHRGLIGKQYKLIYIPTSDGVHFELFDRLKDPLNTQNLWNSLPVVGKAYKDELFELCKKAENAEIINDYIFIPPITK